MTLTLNELFHQQEQLLSSKHKKEEVQPDEGKSKDDSLYLLPVEEQILKNRPRNESRKYVVDDPKNTRIKRSHREKRKSPGKTLSSVGKESNDDVGSQSTTQNKRFKTEPVYKTKHEGESEEEEEEVEMNEDDKDSLVELTDDQFYVNYSETTQAFYSSFLQDTFQLQQSHSEGHTAIHSVPFPWKKRGVLTVDNECSLVGDFDEADGCTSKSLTGRHRPRKRRVITKNMSGKKEITYRLETQEEIEGRVQRMEGYIERSLLRNRWKNRTYNFQCEKDVGNAFFSRAKHYLGSKLRTDKKQHRIEYVKERKKYRKERKRKEREETVKEREIDDDLEEDDELNEQSQLLALLSQNNTLMEDDKDSTISNGPSSTISPQTLNYWALGYSMPRNGDISYDFNPSVENMVNASTVRHNFKRDDYVPRSETKASFRALMTQQFGQRSSRYFFAPNRTIITNANSTFRPGFRSGHIQHLMTMAARSLCCGNNGYIHEISLEDRYLRLLCVRDRGSVAKSDTDVTICANFRMSGYLARISDELGQNLLLFLENVWDNPMEIAKKLGILDSYHDSPINGNMLTKITTHSKNNRSKIKRLHKICSVKKLCNNTNSDIDTEQGITEEESTIIPDVTTSDGIVDVMTMKSGSTTFNRITPTLSDNSRGALITPTSLYSHIAGTSPPIPQCPLDPTSLMFGPVDHHSRFYHVCVKMDSSIYKLMLSTLMTRIGNIRTSNKENLLSKTRKQILILIKEFADINENKLYLRYTNYIQDLSDFDIPLVEFYHGINGYCNFMANCHQEMCHKSLSITNDVVYKTCPEAVEPRQVSGVNHVAEKIWEFCRTRIRQNSLIGFPKLRITFGIALICRSLPSSAAEILSRPIDNNNFCTPLDLFKYTLEDLETKKSISSQNHEENCILAVELEFLFHDASEFFQEAVKIDPINVDYQLWHIGCLASCLLISSGNKISASIHAYPSGKKSAFAGNDSLAHEVRHCLKKYDDVRLELSVAVKALVTLAKYQNSAKAHFAVFSLLEWGQVIGLLVGSALQDFVNDIERLYDYHFEIWAHREPFSFLRRYLSKEKHSFDISFYASILENDPRKIKNWRNFVLCLGSISKTKRGNCWGKDRRWWGDNLLQILPLTTINNKTIEKYDGHIVEIILAKLKKMSITPSYTIIDSSEMDRSYEEYEGNSVRQSVDWLPSRDDIKDQRKHEFNISKTLRSRCYANDLPRANHKVFDPEMDGNSDIIPPTPSFECPFLPKLSSLSQEVQAYKLYIFCSLFGQHHALVQDHIYYNLFLNCCCNIDTKTVDDDCDEFRILVWFVSMGIEMENIMRKEKQQ
mmetsp:Transcript_14465/g.16579  ORF Transcript_14465/g.16579 Transcript_14465/m.16579 type:complete len:1327 (-) Transcript_14465:148-4128(-)